MKNSTVNDIERLKKVKKKFFTFACENWVGHLTPSLSALEILYVLYNKIANITKENLNAIARDRVIISKEHCRYAQCCVLNEMGLLEDAILNTYMKNGSPLGHDLYSIVRPETPAIDVSTGSLGHGIGVGAGMALANSDYNVYIVVGDGELQEGTCWEAIMFIAQNKIKNATIIIDKNDYQIDDLTKNIINTSQFAVDAIEKFGFEIIQCNGHNIEDLEKALKTQTKLPKCIIANTIKGNGMLFKKEEVGCAAFHWTLINEEDCAKAVSGVENDTK